MRSARLPHAHLTGRWLPLRRGYLVDCSKVLVSQDASGRTGAFAAKSFAPGELVEKGVVRRLPMDGSNCPYVFPWDRTWAAGSGCAPFYNATSAGKENTEVRRIEAEDRFEIVALREISASEELTFQKSHLPSEAAAIATSGSPKQLVDCSKVEAKPDAYGGVGVYATKPIKKGEIVERGLVRRLPVDGNECPYVFTWSEDGSVWATGSGCSVYVNASLDGNENTGMRRFMDEDRFEVYALRDIAVGEEITHLYKSIEWRKCFTDLKQIRDKHKTKEVASSREEFTEYWASDHSAATLENMLLDSDAASIDKLERPEILSQIPSLRGKRVLELGAGIGRFSGVLASKADFVCAVDFVAESCQENRKANADKKNLEVIQADVTALDLDPGSFDLVFSNWLFMYLTDEECQALAHNILRWLRPNGHLFFRESCFHASGNAARRFNPTKYRTPEQYSQLFSDALLSDGSRYQLCGTNFLESYAKLKGNLHQYWFRWQRVDPANKRHLMTLQTGQYSPAKILRYEKIYGRGYIYTGGDVISQRILELCPLDSKSRVLDLGAGAAGTAYYLAAQKDVYVHCVNWSSELASVNAGRQAQLTVEPRKRVTFELAPECGVPMQELRYPPNTFDLCVLRESLMYLERQDKAVLLRKLARILRPGGRLVVIDYCTGKDHSELSQEFREHIARWHYEVVGAGELEEVLSHHFQVQSEDCTKDFVSFMEEGLDRIEEFLGPKTWQQPRRPQDLQ
ncbi:unnamed protein product, partial [Effrenium voratum]